MTGCPSSSTTQPVTAPVFPVALDRLVTVGPERAFTSCACATVPTSARPESFTATDWDPEWRVSKPPAFAATYIKVNEATARPAASLSFAQCQARRVSRANCGNIAEADADAVAAEIFTTAFASAAGAVCTVF